MKILSSPKSRIHYRHPVFLLLGASILCFTFKSSGRGSLEEIPCFDDVFSNFCSEISL